MIHHQIEALTNNLRLEYSKVIGERNEHYSKKKAGTILPEKLIQVL